MPMMDINGAETKPADRYEAETRERWGNTDAYRESVAKTANYTADDWKQLKEEGEGIQREMAALLARGAGPTGREARALAEKHRLYLEKWFYKCPPEMHRELGEMYASDPRFTENIDKHGKGLALFMRDSFRANNSGG